MSSLSVAKYVVKILLLVKVDNLEVTYNPEFQFIGEDQQIVDECAAIRKAMVTPNVPYSHWGNTPDATYRDWQPEPSGFHAGMGPRTWKLEKWEIEEEKKLRGKDSF